MYDYITIDDLNDLYQFIPDEDQQEQSTAYIQFACERINALSGTRIETTGFDNLDDIQKELVKRAAARYAWWLFTNGQQWARTNISVSTAAMSTSTGPQEDYIVNIVYRLLQQARLYNPREYFDMPQDDFNYKNIGFSDTFFDGGSYPLDYTTSRKIFIGADNNNFISSDKSVIFKTYLNNNERILDISAKGTFENYFNVLTTGNYISLKNPWRISIDNDFTSTNPPNNSNLVNWNYIKNYVDNSNGGNLEPRVAQNETNIETLRAAVDGHDNDIKSNKNEIDGHSFSIITNSTNISANQTAIITNSGNIQTNTAGITANKNAIDNIPATWTKTTQSSGTAGFHIPQINTSIENGYTPYITKTITGTTPAKVIYNIVSSNVSTGGAQPALNLLICDETLAIKDIVNENLTANYTLTYWVAPSKTT